MQIRQKITKFNSSIHQFIRFLMTYTEFEVSSHVMDPTKDVRKSLKVSIHLLIVSSNSG